MRTCTQVNKVAMTIHTDLRIGSQVVDMLDLETLIREDLLRLLAADHFAHERLVCGNDLCHLRFDRFEIVLGDGMRQLKIVEKAVFCGRPEGDECIRIERLNCFSHDVRCRMAHDLERFRRFGRNDLDRCAIGKLRRKIDERAVHLARDRIARKASTDAGCQIVDGRSFVERSFRTIGKRDFHINILSGAGCIPSICTNLN